MRLFGTSHPREQARETMREMREHPTDTTFSFLENMPESFYFMGTMGSIVASMAFYLMGNRWWSLFVGLWAPTILMSGLFFKRLRPSQEVHHS